MLDNVPSISQDDRLSSPSTESRVYLFATSLLHLAIAIVFIAFPSSVSLLRPGQPADVSALNITWGVLFGISAILGLALGLLEKRTSHWVAFMVFASVCGMWTVMGIYIATMNHADFLRVAIWLYLTVIHTQRARQRSFDYSQARDLLAQIAELRDSSAATTISHPFFDPKSEEIGDKSA